MTNYGIEMIYINHFNKLTSRKEYLDKIFSEFNIPYQYRTHTKQSDKVLSNYYDRLVKSHKKLSLGEFTLTLSHLNIFSDIVEKGYETCLVLEDDAVFPDTFLDNIESVVKESKEYEFSFLSDCCDLHKTKTSDNFLYESDSSRGCCAYLVNNTDNLKEMVKNPFPITEVIDWHLNVIKNTKNLKYSWCEPAIIVQGSENNFYSSNLR